MAVKTPYTFINDFATTLASSYSPGDGILHLASATGANGLSLPTSGYYILKCEDEYFLANSRSGADVTVTAPWGNSTDVSHSSGKIVTGCWVLPDVLDDMRYGSLDIMQSRPYGTKGCQKYEYQTVHPSNSFDVLPTVSGQGYVDCIWIGLENWRNWQFSLTIDGEGTPSTNLVAIENFFGALKLGTTGIPFRSEWLASEFSYMSMIPIPFTTSVKITVKNIDSVDNKLWSIITYQTGVTNNWPYAQKFYCYTGSSTGVAPDTLVTLFDTTFGKKGRFVGLQLAIDASANSDSSHNHVLEGNFQIFLDGAGSPTVESSGTEDWFLMSGYFFTETSPPSYNGDLAALLRRGDSSPWIWSMWRLHVKDPIVFQNALKIKWQCGNTSEAPFTGNTDVFWTIWYYLET